MSNLSDVDLWALDLAEVYARRSKDPNHKVGSIILRTDTSLASAGFNGFPKGTDDDPAIYADKRRKRLRIQHAERNAITFAREDLTGYTMYISELHPCTQCAGAIINSGISRVVARIHPIVGSSWEEDFTESAAILKQAGVKMTIDTINLKTGE